MLCIIYETSNSPSALPNPNSNTNQSVEEAAESIHSDESIESDEESGFEGTESETEWVDEWLDGLKESGWKSGPNSCGFPTAHAPSKDLPVSHESTDVAETALSLRAENRLLVEALARAVRGRAR